MTCYEVYEAAELTGHGEFHQALDLLESIDQANRDAKWYYEYCRANAGLEHYYEAAMAAKKAHALEPDNEEYKKEWKAYRKHRRPYKTGKNEGCCSSGSINEDGICFACCCEGCGEGCCECVCEGICDGIG